MGDNYRVRLRVRMRDGVRKCRLTRVLKAWMDDKRAFAGPYPSNVDFSLALNRGCGNRPDTLAGIWRILLAFHQGDGRQSSKYGWDEYRSAFHGSYSWYAVLEDAFRKAAPMLADGSRMEVSRDSGTSAFEVSDGEAAETEA